VLKQILLGVAILIIATAAGAGYIVQKATSETVTPLKTLSSSPNNPEAIVIYAPGVSDFHQKVTEAFASGLVQSGWNVDIVTASSQTLTDLSNYTLLVIGGPIHGAKPSKALMDYMDRVNSLSGLRVYVLLSSMGGPPQGEDIMTDWIMGHGGTLEGILSLTTMSSNTPVDGATEPTQIATKTAEKIPK
jgi:flavorubredoxin